MNLPFKKRYILGGLMVAFFLYKCSGPDEDAQYQQDRLSRAADDAREQANLEAVSQNQPVPYAPVAAVPAQPVIINQQPTVARDDGGFWQGLVMGHLFSNYHTRDQQTYTRRYNIQRNVTHVHNVTNVANLQHTQPVTNTHKSTQSEPTLWNQPGAAVHSSRPQKTSYSYKSSGYRSSNRSNR
ncbi:hypothetical protein [Leclercia sp.]|uniref:hypothetical protein n=1 Tax=Leclercia sp. TaxID=1898428 RepID=UPI002FDD931C